MSGNLSFFLLNDMSTSAAAGVPLKKNSLTSLNTAVNTLQHVYLTEGPKILEKKKKANKKQMCLEGETLLIRSD